MSDQKTENQVESSASADDLDENGNVIVEIEDGAEEAGGEAKEDKKITARDDVDADEDSLSDDTEDDEDDEDDRLNADQRDDGDNDRAAKRRRQKMRRRRAKELREAEIAAMRQELLASRQQQIQMRAWALQQEAGKLDQDLREVATRYQKAERAYAQAVSKNDGNTAAQAVRAMKELEVLWNSKNSAKERLASVWQQEQQAAQQVQPAPQRAPQPQPQAQPEASEDHLRYAKQFMAENAWYKPSATSGDAKTVNVIDQTLTVEGFDPSSKDYWDELRDRLRVALPHRFKSSQRGSPPVGGARESNSVGTRRMHVPPEVVQAAKEAGYWDDPKKRSNYIRRVMANMKSERTSSAR